MEEEGMEKEVLSTTEMAELESYGLGPYTGIDQLSEQIQQQTRDKRVGRPTRPSSHIRTKKEKEQTMSQSETSMFTHQPQPTPGAPVAPAPMPTHPAVVSLDQAVNHIAWNTGAILRAFQARSSVKAEALRTLALAGTATAVVLVGGLTWHYLTRPAVPDMSSLPAKK